MRRRWRSGLTDALGLTVRILHRIDGEGVLSGPLPHLEQLDDIARRLETGPVVGTAKAECAAIEDARGRSRGGA